MASVPGSKPKVGVRNTKQRSAVIALLDQTDHFISAQDIHRELQHQGYSVGLTTVYRTVQSLADVEAVDVLHMASGETLYRSCHSEAHHHHLVCTQCGNTVEIDGGPVEQWAQTVAEKYGYELSGHDAEVFGVCPQCRSKQ